MRALFLLLLAGCDPQLAISGGPQTKRTIEGCPDALDHLRQCCPQYDSYLSCTVYEKWEGAGSADLTTRESRCLQASDCAKLENAITGGSSLCGVTFVGHRCRTR